MFTLTKSPNKSKKLRVYLQHGGYMKIIDFGANGYNDFITYYKEDPANARKKREAYISRHSVNQEWGPLGLDTAGFWARWILWEKPTLADAIKNVERKFGLVYHNL